MDSFLLTLLAAAGLAVTALGTLALVLQRRASARLALMAATFDTLAQARLVTDPSDRCVLANSAWGRQFGIDAAYPLAALEEQIKDDAEALAQLGRLKSAAASGTSARAEFRLVRNGAVEWRDASVMPIGGLAGHALWGVEDITARKEMEQIIREEQEKLIDFLENAPIGFYSVDEHGRFLFVNNTLANWLGHTPEEIAGAGRTLDEFVVGGAAGRSPHSPFRDGAEPERGEVTLRGRDGGTFTAYVAQTVVRAEDGGGLRTRSLVRDLTIEREWADALKQSEQRFHRFFEEAPLGIVLIDAEGQIREHNAAFAKMIGLGELYVINRPLAEFVQNSDRPTLAEQMMAASSGVTDPMPFELTLARNGSKVVVSALMRRLEEGATPSGLILHLADITEQKTLEAQFLQSQKMELVGQLAGGVAHDFNNLLTAMIGFCDLLLIRHRPGDQSFADIMQIRQNANRAANLVRQLLAFSRQQTLQPKVLNVTDALAELSNLLRRLIGASIELKMVHGRDLGLVRVDQGQLEQVIINLAVNARDAMTGGGTLSLHTFNVLAGDARLAGRDALPDTDYVAISMTDTGCGIPKDHLDKIFEPFFTTKEVGMGTGLGLSTVYGIIKQTGGLIAVDSEIDKGSTFTIFLPRHRGEAKEALPLPQREPQRRRDLTGAGVVLLVEDEDAVRKFGARALRNKGYTVIEASNGEGALELLGKGEVIDILITDIVMPGVDGPSLIRQVREQRPDLKVICISGYTEDSFRKRLDTDGSAMNVHFLPKPFSLQQLAGKVKEVIHAS